MIVVVPLREGHTTHRGGRATTNPPFLFPFFFPPARDAVVKALGMSAKDKLAGACAAQAQFDLARGRCVGDDPSLARLAVEKDEMPAAAGDARYAAEL